MSKHLKIVKYDPQDFSLGEALLQRHGKVESSNALVSAALSLYFQWIQKASCHGCIRRPGGEKVFECSMEVDEFSGEIDYLFLNLDDEQVFNSLVERDEVLLTFEVFYTAYSFRTSIIAKNGKNRKVAVVPPTTLQIQKFRRLPRVEITADLQASAQVIVDNQRCSVLEIGADSLVVESDKITGKSLGIEIDSEVFEGELVRSDHRKTVIKLRFKTGEESYRYFKFYQKFRYPQLKSFFDSDSERVLDLYQDVGFFRRYATDGEQAIISRRERAKKTWEDCKAVDGKEIAMQVAYDDSGRIVGSSTTMKYFRTEEYDVWFFTQMGLRAEPDLFECSHALYQWRIESLLIRPENLFASAVYSDQGKWLNRMWTKFCVQSEIHKETQPVPVDIRQVVVPSESSTDVDLSPRSFGHQTRYDCLRSDLWAGFGPDLLNLANIGDSIIPTNLNLEVSQFEQIAKSLVSCSSRDKNEMYYWFKDGQVPESLAENPRYGCTRWMRLHRNELTDLMVSFEHTVAVYQRKKMKGAT